MGATPHVGGGPFFSSSFCSIFGALSVSVAEPVLRKNGFESSSCVILRQPISLALVEQRRQRRSEHRICVLVVEDPWRGASAGVPPNGR